MSRGGSRTGLTAALASLALLTVVSGCVAKPRVGEVTRVLDEYRVLVRQADGTDALRYARRRHVCDVGDLFKTCSMRTP